MRSIQPGFSASGRRTLLLLFLCSSVGLTLGLDRSVRSAEPATASSGISITGAVEHPRTVTLEDLKREPAITQAVTLKTGHGTLSGSFTGVSLWNLLQHAGLKSTDSRNNGVIRRTITVTGSDGYATVLSAAELSPEFGSEQALLAYARDGKPLAGPGFARLILPGDKTAGRAILGVTSISVH
jgi:DMSO/TMAO reductase YedYZ molybdopterin-dependent catalytic subunit